MWASLVVQSGATLQRWKAIQYRSALNHQRSPIWITFRKASHDELVPHLAIHWALPQAPFRWFYWDFLFHLGSPSHIPLGTRSSSLCYASAWVFHWRLKARARGCHARSYRFQQRVLQVDVCSSPSMGSCRQMDKCQMTARYLAILVPIPLSSLDPSLSSPHLAGVE